MTEKPATAAVTDIEDAATEKWLARTLAQARAHIKTTPSQEAVDRVRARVLGEAAPRKVERTKAA
ncbi:MAG: hypothetical protein WEC75_06070 [Dehalococcoidia bacterium]